MLARQQRLSRQRDIRAVLEHGRCIRTPHLLICLLPRPASKTSRAVCRVSRRVHALAVRRHRYQRWLRAALIELLPRLDRSYDIVLTATPRINTLQQSQELRAELSRSLDWTLLEL